MGDIESYLVVSKASWKSRSFMAKTFYFSEVLNIEREYKDNSLKRYEWFLVKDYGKLEGKT